MFIFLFHKKMNIRELTYNRRFLVLSDGKHFPSKAIEAARQFAEGFEKSFCLLALCDKPQEAYASQAEAYVSTCPVDLLYSVCSGTLQDVCDMSERTETPIILQTHQPFLVSGPRKSGNGQIPGWYCTRNRHQL